MAHVIKRDGDMVSFDRYRIYHAIVKAMEDCERIFGNKQDITLAYDISSKIEEEVRGKTVSIEEIQDMVENYLMTSRQDVAKLYILYRDEQMKKRKQPWKMDELQKAIFENKYEYEKEGFENFLDRVSGDNKAIRKMIRNKKFLPAGRIMSNRGLQKHGKKVTYSNCYVITPPEDSIESIFEVASKLARTYSFGGGCGVDIGKLAPRHAKVNNSARETSGAVSFMELYSLVTGLIGQNGRRGALMLSIPCDHPDLVEFINVKNDLNAVTKANISIRITDEFMYCVANDLPYTLSFTREATGETISKEVDAREVFNMLALSNWRVAEPGILFWDRISNWCIVSDDPRFVFAGTNPCAEEPLPAGGSCLLGSLNLSAFVRHQFTPFAYFDYQEFSNAVKTGVIYLNEVLDEGLPLHPLQEQRDTVRNWRQVGLTKN
jgi:ribonucleoside-diphosphate reductase alpha chain